MVTSGGWRKKDEQTGSSEKEGEEESGDEARRADGNEIFEEAKVRRGELCDL